MDKLITEYNIEKAYQGYLNLMKLDETKMNETQKTETRRAFYGGCGVMIKMMWNDDIFSKSDDDLLKIVKDLENQVSAFWSSAVIKNKSKLN